MPETTTEEWSCSTHEETWNGGETYATRDDAVACALGEGWTEASTILPETSGDLDLMPGQRFWSGQVVAITAREVAEAAGCGQSLLENIGEWLYEQIGDEASDGQIEATHEQVLDLDARLAATIEAWLVAHGLEPTCYRIEHATSHFAPETPHAYVAHKAWAGGKEPIEYCRVCERGKDDEMHASSP